MNCILHKGVVVLLVDIRETVEVILAEKIHLCVNVYVCVDKDVCRGYALLDKYKIYLAI